MLTPAMTAPRTRKPAATKPTPRAKSALSQHGDAAKLKAERSLLLKTLRAQSWGLSATARELGMGDASAVLRALDKYGARAEYEKHKP